MYGDMPNTQPKGGSPVALSKSAKARLIRQSLALIRRLESRLTTCPIEKFEQVKEALLAERKAFQKLAS